MSNSENLNDKSTFFCLVGHDNVVNSAQLSHDNSWFLTASADRTAKIWSPKYSDPVLTFSSIKHNSSSDKVSSNSNEVSHFVYVASSFKALILILIEITGLSAFLVSLA